MDHTQELKTAIPQLRRYARALSGTQHQGDEYVRLCLETVLQEPERLGRSDDPKLDLFSLFHQVWSGVGAVMHAAGVDTEQGDDDALRHQLSSLPEREREVLLLVSLEGFTVAQAAEILGIDEEAAQRSLAAAKAQIQRNTGARVLIIEDEAIIAMNIAAIVKASGHTVVATAARKDKAIALAREHQPNLVLADVQLQHGEDGIDAVREILRAIHVPVIFVTGYPERLLTGNGIEPAFVIAKPFAPETLQTAIGQALWLGQSAEPVAARERLHA